MDEEKYDSSLDVFSYGVIVAQIVCKLETIKSAKDRSFFVAQIPHTHRLRKLIDSCLQEDMTKRPSARDICESIRYREVIRLSLICAHENVISDLFVKHI